MIVDEIFTRVVGSLLVVALVGFGGLLYRLWDHQRIQARRIRQLETVVNSLVDNLPDAQAAASFRTWVTSEFGRDDVKRDGAS